MSTSELLKQTVLRRFAPSAQYSMHPVRWSASPARARARPSSCHRCRRTRARSVVVALPMSCWLWIGLRARSADSCAGVSSMSRTQMLTEDTETPTRAAISLIEAPSSARI
jgi:hypothetical protein